MNKQVNDDYWKELQNRLDKLSLASQYYALSSLVLDVMDIAKNLDDHAKWVISNLVNIRLTAFEMFPNDEFCESLDKEIKMERKLRKSIIRND